MNRKKIILTVLISILILTVGGIYYIFVIDSPSKIAINDIEGHRKYQDNHSKVLVTGYYEKLLSENPNSASAKYYVARLIQTESEERAFDLATTSIKLDATNKYAYIILADIYRTQGNFSKSLEFITKANEKGLSKEDISYRRVILLEAMFNKISVDKLELMFSHLYAQLNNWPQSITFNDFFFMAKNDTQYFLDNPKYMDTLFGINTESRLDILLGLEKIITHCKLIEENVQHKKRLERNCSSHGHQEFLEDRYSSLGNTVYSITLVNKLQDCVFMWSVICKNNYGSLNGCDILTGLDNNGEIKVLKANCE